MVSASFEMHVNQVRPAWTSAEYYDKIIRSTARMIRFSSFKLIALILGESPLVQYSTNTCLRTWIWLDANAARSTNEDRASLKRVRST